jgi:acetyl-CoA carboxylase carboxyl transferase subunit alpha
MIKKAKTPPPAAAGRGRDADSSRVTLSFERHIVELEQKINELRSLGQKGIDLESEIRTLERKLDRAQRDVYSNLTPWQRVQLARHPSRPFTLDYIQAFVEDFIEIHGDRLYGDDKALVAGFGRIGKRRICVLGHQKGRDTRENLMRMFGSAHPEGYRKAIRVMRLAEKFRIPILSFIDTPGAYPGIGAEERGQAGAIAFNLREMADLTVPVIVVVIGEGGSGGALGIGVGDRIFILENAYYSVISPEGCAAILWKDNTKASDAAEALRLTAKDLLGLGVIDGIIPEPLGGAHHDPGFTAAQILKTVESALEELEGMKPEELLEQRYRKFRKMGVFLENRSK